MWNASYQAMFDKTKSLIKADVCIKFFDKTKPFYLETDASRIGLGTTLLQPEMVLHVQKILLETTLFSGPSHLQVKA